MSHYVKHSYHLVDESPWPLLSSGAAFFLTTGLVQWFWTGYTSLLFASLTLLLASMIQWWRDVSAEASLQGLHSAVVELGMRWGMGLFIVSEVMFFSSFFWAFFHNSLSPAHSSGGVWPPQGVLPFNPWQVPLLNTMILLSSGVSVTWAHHALASGCHANAVQGLAVTLFLGGYFTLLQAWEYHEASFSIMEGIFGSTFFVATGFHGLHVIVGSLFLGVSLLRLRAGLLSPLHHFGFEAAAWYWHFVDVVWLYLFAAIYVWGA